MRIFKGLGKAAETLAVPAFRGGGAPLSSKHKAFTLAEVLITLGIIGTVAALTLPSLISKHQDRVTVTKLKKAYNILLNASHLMIAEHGEIRSWYDRSSRESCYESCQVFYDDLTSNVKTLKKCSVRGKSHEKGCFTNKIKMLHGKAEAAQNYDGGTYKNFVLADGVSVLVDCMCDGTLDQGDLQNLVYIDVNGPRPPNTFAKDVFRIGVYGFGPIFQLNKYTPEQFLNDCTLEAVAQGDPKGRGVYSCTDWVLMYGNLDYLHCTGLSVDGKTSCK